MVDSFQLTREVRLSLTHQMNAEEDRTFLCGICVNLRSLRSLLVSGSDLLWDSIGDEVRGRPNGLRRPGHHANSVPQSAAAAAALVVSARAP